jgi:hypothetical protein
MDATTIHKIAASIVIVVTLGACVVLAIHGQSLRAEVQATTDTVAESQHRAALALIDSGSLPSNRPLSICNNSTEEITVSSVTAVYWDAQGALKNFNSAKHQWHMWRVSAGATEPLNLLESDGTGWDGSVVFYAMDLHRQSKDMLLSGTSDDLKDGCIAVTSETGAR